MIDDTLLEAEEKMEKAVAVAKDDFARDPHRPREPVDVQQDHGRLLRHADPGEPARVVHVARGADGRSITPYDKGALAAIEKAIRDSDLGVNPTNDGNDHPRRRSRSSPRSGARSTSRSRSTRPRTRRVAIRNIRRHAKDDARQAEQGRRGRRGRRAPRGEGARGRDAQATSAQIDELLKHKEAELLEV